MSNKVKFSDETFVILEAAAKINNSIKLSAGNIIKTASADDAIAMYAVIADEIPIDAGLYDLSQFLNLFRLAALKDAELEFEDKRITIHGDRTKVQYWFCDESFLKNVDKISNVKLPSIELTVDIDQNDLTSFSRGAATLGHKFLQFVVENKTIKLVATTPGIDTSNNLEIDIGATEAEDNKFTLSLNNLKLIPGSYKVEISSRGHTKWSHKEQAVIFYIGLEPSA